MAMSTYCKKQLIIKAGVGSFVILAGEIMNLIEKDGIIFDSRASGLIQSLDYLQNGVETAFDWADYLVTKRDALVCADLIKQAIDRIQNSEYSFTNGAYELFMHFYDAILHYAYQLEGGQKKHYSDMVIECKGQLALKLNRDDFVVWHNALLAAVQDEQGILDDDVKGLLNAIGDTINAGKLIDLDIADYLKTNSSGKMFAELMELATKKIERWEDPLWRGPRSLICNFRLVVLTYAAQLPTMDGINARN